MISPAMTGASIKALWDMDRCRFEKRWQYQIKDGVNILNEVTFLAREASADGVEVVLPCTGAAITEKFAGVALHSGIQGYVWANVIKVVVPTVPDLAGNYVVDVGHKALKLNPAGLLAATQVWATGVPAPWTIAGGPFVPPVAPGAGIVAVDAANGLYYFDPANAGAEVTITYRWDLSAVEHAFLMRENLPNRGVEGLFSIITVGCGHCIVYTMMYDARPVWVVDSAVAGELPVLAPNGEITTSAQRVLDGGPAGVVIGKVIKKPTTDDPYLGIEYTTWI